MTKIEVKSENQSGGITANNVSLQQQNSFILNEKKSNKETETSKSEAEKPKGKVAKILGVIVGIVTFIAAVVKILEYFHITILK